MKMAIDNFVTQYISEKNISGMSCMGGREKNEDKIGYSEIKFDSGEGRLLVVCDGMGGHEGGKYAAEKTISIVLEEMLARKYESLEAAAEALKSSIQMAHDVLVDFNLNSGKDSGCTLVTSLIYEDLTYVYHVGDSRAYIMNRGILYHITKDHSIVQNLVDTQKISAFDAHYHPESNIVLRAIGIPGPLAPSGKRVNIKENDKIILVTDGLHEGFEVRGEKYMIIPYELLAGALNDDIDIATKLIHSRLLTIKKVFPGLPNDNASWLIYHHKS